MKNLIIFCKSYRNDLQRFSILADSINKFNVENIPFYVSVPPTDTSLFKNMFGDSIAIISDDVICSKLPTMRGWEQQQIIKSSFWKLNLCKNYLMIDSDSYFIKPFKQSDFLFDDNTPYTVIHEQKDLFSWSAKNHNLIGFNPKQSFEQDRLFVMNIFDRRGKIYDFGPGPVIWSCKVWESLENEYLIPNKLTFQSLISQLPSEFSWYGEWLLFNNTIPIYPLEPIFKFFHYYQEYAEFKNMGYTLEHWKENYYGVVMQSSSNLPIQY